MKRTLLVTSVGSLISQAIIDSLGARREAFHIVGTNSDPSAPGNFLADTTYLVPASAEAEAFLQRMREILQAERPDIVLAGRDGDLEGLAILQGEPEHHAIRFLTPPPAAAAIVLDKYRSFAFAQAHGLPFAESVVEASALDGLIARKGLPLIGKPRSGHGAIGASVVRTREEALRVLASRDGMLQEFLDPPADPVAGWPDPGLGMPLHFAVRWPAYLSPTVLIGPGGALIGCSLVHITKIGGTTAQVTPVDDPALERFAQHFAAPFAELGLLGPLNIQCCRRADGSYVPFELNARFTGTSAARARLGFNEVLAALDHCLDAILPQPLAGEREPCFVVRTLSDRLVRRADVQRLAIAGKWSARS